MMIKDVYPYLKDPRALAEIRKHKWIESQKQGREIGFASAAVDWIKNYGEAWKQIHVEGYKDKSIFMERRDFRRFNLNCAIELIKNNAQVLAEAVNVSFFGILCRTTDYLHQGTEIGVHIFSEPITKKGLICNAVIDRVYPVGLSQYELFLRFDNHSQQKIENWEYLRNCF